MISMCLGAFCFPSCKVNPAFSWQLSVLIVANLCIDMISLQLLLPVTVCCCCAHCCCFCSLQEACQAGLHQTTCGTC